MRNDLRGLDGKARESPMNHECEPLRLAQVQFGPVQNNKYIHRDKKDTIALNLDIVNKVS